MTANDSRYPIVLDLQQSQNLDALTLQKIELDEKLLMGWAALQVMNILTAKKWFNKIRQIHIFTGPGNNGGDGYALAYLLVTSFSRKITVWSTKEPVSPAGLSFYQSLFKIISQPELGCGHLEMRSFASLEILQQKMEAAFQHEPKGEKSQLIIDALFGLGLTRPLDSDFSRLIAFLNKLPRVKRLAVDVPSGIHSNGDFCSPDSFRADLTVTFGYAKKGMLVEPAFSYCGKIHTVQMGFIHPSSVLDPRIDRRRLSPKLLQKELKQMPFLRGPTSHKYSSGTLVMLGGFQGYEGAGVLCSHSFLKCGGGIATIFSNSEAAVQYLNQKPQLLIHREAEFAILQQKLLDKLNTQQKLSRQILVIGPGMQPLAFAAHFVKELLMVPNLAIIWDAQALRNIGPYKQLFREAKNQVNILTPHFGEALALLAPYQIENSIDAAKRISQEYNSVVYWKGAGGMISDYRHTSQATEIFLESKNYHLATAGSGDVLCGILASFLLRFENPLQAIEMAIFFYLQNSKKSLKKTLRKKIGDFFVATDIYR